MTKVEFILQYLNGTHWIQASLPNRDLQPVIDLGLDFRKNTPEIKQRIIRRVTEITDEVLITEI